MTALRLCLSMLWNVWNVV